MKKYEFKRGKGWIPWLVTGCVMLFLCAPVHAQEQRTYKYDEDGNRTKRIDGKHVLDAMMALKEYKVGEETVIMGQSPADRLIFLQRKSRGSSLSGKAIVKKGEEIRMEVELKDDRVTLDFNNYKKEQCTLYIIIGDASYSTTINR